MKTFLGIEKPFTDLADAPVVILPIPYEATTSYGNGTRNGPEAIIDASEFVELYDEEMDAEVYRQGIHTAETLSFGPDVIKNFDKISKTAGTFLDMKKFVISIGGEHSITFPLVKAWQARYPDLTVLQLDAHSDLRESYEGSIYSHASVMARVRELTTQIVQVGIRSQCVEEARLIKEQNIHTNYAHTIRDKGWDACLAGLSKNVYLTLDVDFFDPAVVPATGTPEPGGFFWYETLTFLKKVFKDYNVVGLDIVEFSPIKGLAYPEFTIAKLIYKLIGFKLLNRTE